MERFEKETHADKEDRIERPQELSAPKWSYDDAAAEIALLFESGTSFLVKDVVLKEPNETESIFLGTDNISGEEVVIVVHEFDSKLEVFQVLVNEQVIYAQPMN